MSSFPIGGRPRGSGRDGHPVARPHAAASPTHGLPTPMCRAVPALAGVAALAVLAGCADLDLDVRDLGNGFDTSNAALAATADRPRPDNRGVISYPGYQVAIARRGDTVADVAGRVGLPADELARFNGAPVTAVLNSGEVLALPRRVSEPSPATGAATTGPIQPPGSVDVSTLAGAAIERAEGAPASAPTAPVQTGQQPQRHQVNPGETAFSIARRYGVPVAALAEWNGLDGDFTLREGQYLLIPPRVATPAAQAAPPPPGAGSPTPTPPSAAEPLPEDQPAAADADGTTATESLPDSPNLAEDRTAASASTAQLVVPVTAPIIRDFQAGRTDGIDFSAQPGSPVRAAAAGTVGFITEDTGDTRVILIRHADGLNTIYGNVRNPSIAVGARVSRGQTIAEVGDASPPVFRFEVRDGIEAVDPNDYIR